MLYIISMNKTEITKPKHGSLKWQAVRHRDSNKRCVVGASEVAVIMGQSPYETITDLAIRKLLPPEVTDTNDAMERGNVLEPALIAHAEKKLNEPLLVPKVMYLHGRIIATLDARSKTNLDRLVEAKTNNTYMLGNPLPASWMWQAQAQMFCTGATEVIFVILDKSMRLGFETVYRSEELIESMVAQVELFCEAIDEERLPTDDPLTAPQVSLLHPEAAGEVELDGNGIALIEEWQAIKHAIKDLEDQEKELKDALANTLLDKEFGTVAGHRVLSFKAQTTKRFDSKKLIADHPELENKYTITSTFRVMRNVR